MPGVGRPEVIRSIYRGYMMQCPPCKGSGVKPGHTLTKCELCDGVGQLPNDRLTNLPCSFCKGGGIMPGHQMTLCSVCQGWGRVPDKIAAALAVKKTHPAVISTLRQTLNRMTSQQCRNFVEEAVGCAEAKFYRAAIVLTWAGAIRVLQENVVAKNLVTFNAEASRRDAKWRAAKTADDLSRMKEYDFLQILEAISMIGKSVKTELEVSLKLRNSCAHPNSFQVGENRTAAHIESLVLNVLSVFP